MIQQLQATMADDVGPFRDAARLTRALSTIDELTRALGDRVPPALAAHSTCSVSTGSTCATCCSVARSVAQSALARTESRGAHQREDHADTRPEWQVNQEVRWRNGELSLARTQCAAAELPA